MGQKFSNGTITPTDTLVDSALKAVRQSPLNLLGIPFWLLRGKAALKARLATEIRLDTTLLPYREPFLAYLREEHAKGRRLVLATAAHRSIAEAVAAHLQLFSQVIATDATRNLKGANKLQAIREEVGEPFVYAGDCAADLPIWLASAGAVLLNVPADVAATVRAKVPVEREFGGEPTGFGVWLKALRIHQWAKNLLLFVPLLTAFSFTDPHRIGLMLSAFLAFSLTASATYMVNDLWDLESDRAHPRKRLRPFASGILPIQHGAAAAGGLLLVGFALAHAVSLAFCAMLAVYLVLTTLYSLVLKRRTIIDVLMLALLYTLRILAGSVAIAVSTTSWLLAVSLFAFLSLALIKRCAELVALRNNGKHTAKGRNYRVEDLAVLWPAGVSSAFAAVVVFGLFISAPETRTRYLTPELLWGVALLLIYWLTRLWIKTARGEMHDDPVIYAARDLGSRLTIIAMVTLVLFAHFTSIPLPF